MKHPLIPDKKRPRRPARSVREIRRRKKREALGEDYQPLSDRLLYAFLNSLMYAIGGFLLDGIIVLVRSVMGVGTGTIFWLFTPFLFVLGAIVGLIDGKRASADSMDMLGTAANTPSDNYSMHRDIFRGLGLGIFIFAIIWMMLMMIA